MPESGLKNILATSRTIAVVGMSDRRHRESNRIGHLLRDVGYTIYPVNPTLAEVDGMTSYASLAELPVKPDIVNVFRNSDHAEEVVDQAIENDVKVLWFQLGAETSAAVDRGREAGIKVISGRCIAVEVRINGITIPSVDTADL